MDSTLFVCLGVIFLTVNHLVSPTHGGVVTPIPLTSQRPGVTYGKGTENAQVRVDAYLDLFCPDSLAAWPILKQVADHYNGSQVQLVINVQTLPYHRNSFMAKQGYHMLLDKYGSTAAFKYMGACLENYDKMSTINTFNMSGSEVLWKIADLAASVTPVSKDDFYKENSNYYDRAIVTWKYNVQREVSGTPWYFVNDVMVQTDASMTFTVWTKLISDLLKQH